MYFDVEKTVVNFRKQKVEKKTKRIFAVDKEQAEAEVAHMNRKARAKHIFMPNKKTGEKELVERAVPETYKLKGKSKRKKA